jgi:pimeloyl-ACP methyl ester carboxylesterase
MGSSARAWDLIAPALGQHNNFITLDLPGHGEAKIKSSKQMHPKVLADLVVTELAQAGITKFHLVGNSLGGWICLEIASRHPDSVLSVTAVAPAGLWLVPDTKRHKLLATSRMLARATYRFSNHLLKIHSLKALGFAAVSPKWRDLPHEICVQAARAMGSATGYYDLWDGFLGTRFESEIDAHIPITILFGDSDNTLPAATCQERSLAPNHAKWVTLVESGHAPMWDQADLVIAQIRLHL